MGGAVTLSCPPGLYLQGSALAECRVRASTHRQLSIFVVFFFFFLNTFFPMPPLSQLGGAWAPSVSSVSCEVVVCEKPPPLLQGVTEGDSYNYGDVVMYSCLPGFTMKVPSQTPDLDQNGCN